MDRRLAEAVAQHEGAVLNLHYFDGSGDDDGFDMGDFVKLAAHCDLVLGFPVDADARSVPSGLRMTEPYGHTGFVLVTPHGRAHGSLAQLPPGTRVAVTYQTIPNLYFADHPGLQADVELSDTASLQALQTGKVDAAMLWQPTVASYLAAHDLARRYDVHELNEPHARFNLVALYDEAHAAEARRFELAVAKMAASGELARTLAPYAQAGSATPDRRAGMTVNPWRHTASRTCDATRGKGNKSKGKGHLPALYTQAQADSGKQKFLDNCSRCHGRDLAGIAGPALKGPNFASPSMHFTVGDIFTIVSQNMPATQPGSLPQQDYVEIMAFLLQQNGYPAGSTPLTYEAAKQSKANFVYHGD
ncbi:hypothetical protein ALSL_0373 [Aerosticca soli]|uniref:Cytochrome c domain-containing protein n=2 Tax=Aerosticca soli TaxID=2010829 RepID=A0A2Z6E2R0_9GAMM|nr:hypothetical protein ALSL_0373 [Aerosticca soli]